MMIPLRIGWPDVSGGRRVLAAAALGFVVLALGGWWHHARGRDSQVTPVVYVCTETKEAFLAPPQGAPAVNPKTGRRTLVRGLYCSGCGRWFPAPPARHQTGNPKPVFCRIHKVPMIYDGPPPRDATAVVLEQ